MPISKYPRNDAIGIDVGITFPITFSYFDREWIFQVRSKSEENIAKTCMNYYREMWEIHGIGIHDTVLDIGGHVGFFALPISHRVKHVHVYEPSRANYELLTTNMRQNNVPNVTAYNEAIASTESVQRFNLGVFGTTGHYLASVGRKIGSVHYDIQCRNADNVIAKTGATILKSDCEGAEWEIFANCNLDGIRMMVVELHKVKERMHIIQEFMDKHGFDYTVRHSSWFSKLVAWRKI